MIFSFALSLIYTACKKQDPVKIVQIEHITLDNVPQDTLHFDVIRVFSDLFPPEFYILNDSLVMFTDPFDASHLKILNINNNVIGDYYVKKMADRIKISEDATLKASVDFLNKANNVYYEFIVDKGILYIDTFTRLRIGENSPSQAFKMEKDIFVGTGTHSKGLFAVHNRNQQSKQVHFFGNYPVTDPNYQTLDFVINYYRGEVDRREDQLVYASSLFGYMVSYKYKEKKLIKEWEKQFGDFLFTGKPSRFIFDDLHCFGFTDVCLSKRHIYAVFDGTSKNDQNKLLIFSREGKLEKYYALPCSLISLSVDEKEENLYAFTAPLTFGVIHLPKQ